jgi:hypothetical protein
VKTRANMADELALNPSAPTKTFVLEVHADDPVAYLADLAGDARFEETADAFLFRLVLGEAAFWVDQLDERFWSFHTDMPASTAGKFLRERVEQRREIDWMWLPSDHLRGIWPGAVSRRVRTEFKGGAFLGETVPARDLRVQLSGHDAEELLEYIGQHPRYRSAVSFEGVELGLAEPEFGWVNEGVNRMGRFAVSGDSLELHLQFVRSVIGYYKQLVTLCEQRAISWWTFEPDTGGGIVGGGPITIRFSRSIDDMDGFLSELFAVRRPFRLWGMPQKRANITHVEAVDLHVGQRLPMDIGRDWLRVYLQKGSCGNSIARLISNLQHRFDGTLSMVDPELQAAIDARPQQLAS